MLSEIQDLARRLEQQVISYERMHADELKNLQDQLTTFQRLQGDELQMLHDELNQLKQELAIYIESAENAAANSLSNAPKPHPIDLTITRRELITGNFDPKQI